jgi:hypothetical protein
VGWGKLERSGQVMLDEAIPAAAVPDAVPEPTIEAGPAEPVAVPARRVASARG